MSCFLFAVSVDICAAPYATQQACMEMGFFGFGVASDDLSICTECTALPFQCFGSDKLLL